MSAIVYKKLIGKNNITFDEFYRVSCDQDKIHYLKRMIKDGWTVNEEKQMFEPKPKRPVSVERIEKVIRAYAEANKGFPQYSELAKAILAEINEGEA